MVFHRILFWGNKLKLKSMGWLRGRKEKGTWKVRLVVGREGQTAQGCLDRKSPIELMTRSKQRGDYMVSAKGERSEQGGWVQKCNSMDQGVEWTCSNKAYKVFTGGQLELVMVRARGVKGDLLVSCLHTWVDRVTLLRWAGHGNAHL